MSKKLHQVNTRVPEAVLKRLDAIASEQGLSRFQLVRKILTHYAESYRQEPTPEAEPLAKALALILARLDRLESLANTQQQLTPPPKAITPTELPIAEPLALSLSPRQLERLRELCRQRGVSVEDAIAWRLRQGRGGR